MNAMNARTTKPTPVSWSTALRVGLVSVVVLALSACTGLPRSGPVETSRPQLPAAQAADFFAGSPREGSSPTEIVDDFLRAQSAGYSDTGFDVAREFLMPEVAATWDPTAPVRVYAEGPAPRSTTADDGAVVVSATIAGVVDARGTYADAAPGTEEQLRFSLVRDAAGEWRIAELEDGVLLSSYEFSTIFSSLPLYFLTADSAALVPDLRWFPRDGIATRAAQELLRGPSALLEDVAQTALPSDTDLVGDSVEVADVAASVELDGPVTALGEPARSLAAVQLERTLFGVANVREVAVMVGGERVVADPAVAAVSNYPLPATATPIGLRAGGVVRLGDLGSDAVVDVGEIGGVSPDGLAQSYDGASAVVRDEGRRLIAVDLASRRSTLLVEGAALVGPSIDRHNWVWSAEAGTEPGVVQGLRVVERTGSVAEVSARWLEGRTVSALAVSREGSRIVVASSDETGSRLDVAGVERSANGRPVALGDPVSIGSGLRAVEHVAWVEDVMVAALGRPSEETIQPVVTLVPIGGASRELPLVDNAVSVTASRGARSLMVGTTAGEVWVRNGAGWRVEVRGSVTEPSYPG